MIRLTVSEILIEGAKLLVEEIDLSKEPEVAALFKETEVKQEDIKKLKDVDEEQLKLVVQL